MMNILYAAAQGIGILAVVLQLLLMHGKNMRNILHRKLCMDIAWAAHFLILGAYTGFLANVLCLMRELVFLKSKADRNSTVGKMQLLLFVLLNWVGAALTWRGVYSLIPAAATSIATYSYWQKNVTVTRVIGMVCNILMFTYDVFVLSYAGMLGETLSFLSIALALFLGRKSTKQPQDAKNS